MIDEQVYNELVSEKIKEVSDDNFYFKISELKSKTNKEKTFNASEELRQLSKKDAKGVEAELKCLLEEEANHLDCLQTGGTGYPISTAHLLKSAVMPLKSITESLER